MNLTASCYENLEKAEVLGSLLQEKFADKKDAAVSLEMLVSYVKKAQKLLINIQNVTKENPLF